LTARTTISQQLNLIELQTNDSQVALFLDTFLTLATRDKVMNLGTVRLILGCILSLLAIFAYFLKGVEHNKAKIRAQHGRTSSLINIVQIQDARLDNIEKHLSIPQENRGVFPPNDGLNNLEQKALDEYKEHHTNFG